MSQLDISSEDRSYGWTMPFFILALVGFLTSLVIHLSTFLGFHPSMAKFWPLHIGIFLVFFPTILLMRKKRRPGDSPNRFNMDDFPKWLKNLCVFFFVYAIVNFALFMYLNHGGGPNIKDGQYVLSSHGRVIQTLTEEEYRHYQALETRGFSGHWMMFYCWSMAALGTAALKGKGGEKAF